MSIAIGKILQAAREERGLTLDQVAGATHIRLRYLQAMEAGDFEALPSRLQVKGFLRSYASYLGLNEKDLLEMLEPEISSTPRAATPKPAPELQISEPPAQDSSSRFVEVGEKLRAQRPYSSDVTPLRSAPA